MTAKKPVIIALGSNLGDKSGNLSYGLKLLADQIAIERCSNIYESKALLPEAAPEDWDRDFHNCVIYGKTELKPYDLLTYCNVVENRVAGEKRQKNNWAPRYLDIDIISYDNDIINTAILTVPHAKFRERSFVLLPLQDIMPEWIDPVSKKNINEIIIENKLKLQKIRKLELRPI
jgi:2-amino-4-hydroxy-6-hydroxymethyldihydropteridine diphosphokinase